MKYGLPQRFETLRLIVAGKHRAKQDRTTVLPLNAPEPYDFLKHDPWIGGEETQILDLDKFLAHRPSR